MGLKSNYETYCINQIIEKTVFSKKNLNTTHINPTGIVKEKNVV